MTAEAVAPPRRLAALQGAWRALPPREQRLLRLAAAVVAAALVWLLAVQPAARTLARAPAEIDALDRQAQAMRRLAAEAAELRAAPPVPRALAESALRAATERLGDAGRLTLQGDRAVLSVSGITTGALRDWLLEARAAARARPVEATLTRAGAGYNGTVVVALEGRP
ncbi:MAG: type II secretion system protein M [Burkholderiales bacterium]|nr:type II secretion system protein M [Burkholderiales bacterium]